mgnify:CR=1 FL=1
MQIPDTLKIGALWYKVIQVDSSQIDVDSFHTGDCDDHTQTIRISKSISQEMKEVTLIHEILHAIDMQLDHDLVELLSSAIYQVLKENNLLTK